MNIHACFYCSAHFYDSLELVKASHNDIYPSCLWDFQVWRLCVYEIMCVCERVFPASAAQYNNYSTLFFSIVQLYNNLPSDNCPYTLWVSTLIIIFFCWVYSQSVYPCVHMLNNVRWQKKWQCCHNMNWNWNRTILVSSKCLCVHFSGGPFVSHSLPLLYLISKKLSGECVNILF